MKPVSIEMTVQWSAVIVISISITGLAIVFRQQLYDFIKNNIKWIKIGPVVIKLDMQGLKNVQKKIDMPQVSATANGAVSRQAAEKSADLLTRDIVLNRWGSLKQIVSDVAVSQGVGLTPASKIPDVVERLLGARLITQELADAVNFLFDEGKIVSENTGKVEREYALMYEELSGNLVDWMMVNILIPDKAETANQERIIQRRQTVVGGTDADIFFASPQPGSPIAWLIGKGGGLKGKRIPIDKKQFRIGRSPVNDLCLEEDSYVSENHALLKYTNNILYVYDINSRNGTFVNDRRLKGPPCAVSKGDHLKFGDSVFAVS